MGTLDLLPVYHLSATRYWEITDAITMGSSSVQLVRGVVWTGHPSTLTTDK